LRVLIFVIINYVIKLDKSLFTLQLNYFIFTCVDSLCADSFYVIENLILKFINVIRKLII